MGGAKLTILILLGALGIAGALAARSNMERRCVNLSAADNSLRVPLARLPRGFGRLFCYRNEAGEQLRFVLAREANGTVQAAFDACRRCYKFHEGFDAGHGYVTCRYCDNRYKISELAVGKASCVPVKLRAKVERGDVRVDVADLEAGRWLF